MLIECITTLHHVLHCWCQGTTQSTPIYVKIFFSNQLTARGLHKHEGYNFCDWCHETLYVQKVKNLHCNPLKHVSICQEYGPGPGGETIEERRLREQRELEERERKLREIEEMRNRKVCRIWINLKTN